MMVPELQEHHFGSREEKLGEERKGMIRGKESREKK